MDTFWVMSKEIPEGALAFSFSMNSVTASRILRESSDLVLVIWRSPARFPLNMIWSSFSMNPSEIMAISPSLISAPVSPDITMRSSRASRVFLSSENRINMSESLVSRLPVGRSRLWAATASWISATERPKRIVL